MSTCAKTDEFYRSNARPAPAHKNFTTGWWRQNRDPITASESPCKQSIKVLYVVIDVGIQTTEIVVHSN